MHDYRLDRPVINKKQPSVWYVVWREEGRSRRRSTGSTDKAMARQFLAQYATTSLTTGSTRISAINGSGGVLGAPSHVSALWLW